MRVRVRVRVRVRLRVERWLGEGLREVTDSGGGEVEVRAKARAGAIGGARPIEDDVGVARVTVRLRVRVGRAPD